MSYPDSGKEALHRPSEQEIKCVITHLLPELVEQNLIVQVNMACNIL
jgi:hypothetical protein